MDLEHVLSAGVVVTYLLTAPDHTTHTILHGIHYCIDFGTSFCYKPHLLSREQQLPSFCCLSSTLNALAASGCPAHWSILFTCSYTYIYIIYFLAIQHDEMDSTTKTV